MAIEICVPCPDLDAALAFYTSELGFRLDSVFPADDPSELALSGHGLRVRLQRSRAAPQTDGGWKLGRAGMRYRDLLPDRCGGRLIASHICIPDAGPVPDYVHYHKVEFQLIYCYRGWVRVVYEDQGPPFVLSAGDCVLQPPQIRHRVLECSEQLEVVELGVPAVHETWVDHELELPTSELRPDREFGAQRFARGLDAIATATGGRASARIVRGAAPIAPTTRGAAFVFVLRGQLSLGDVCLDTAAAAVVDRPVTPSTASADVEWLEVMLDYGLT